MTYDDVLDAWWKRVEAANYAPPEERRAELTALAEALGVLREDPDVDAELAYLRGYLGFIHPDRRDSVVWQRHAERHLLAVVRLDPGHDFAWLYLAYHRFNLGDFREALRALSHVREDHFDPWMALKVVELGLCCVLWLDGLEASVEAFAAFVERCEQAERKNDYPMVTYTDPLGLARTLDRTDRTGISAEAAQRLCALARRLDVVGRSKGWISGLLCDDEE